MRKTIISIISAMTTLLIICIGICETTSPSAEVVIHRAFPRTERTESYDDTITVIGKVLNRNYILLISNYAKIPQNVREQFIADGWIISITDENLEETWFAGWDISVCAGTDASKKEIRCENSKAGANAVTHEIGHYLQTKLTEEECNDWLLIYEAEKEQMSEYAQESPWEGFAECVNETYTNPEKINDCPMAKAFIDSITKKLPGTK